MDRRRNRRTFLELPPARRRPVRRAMTLDRRAGRPPAPAPDDDAVVGFLSDVLVGDTTWTLAEVRTLIEIRESADTDR